MQFVPFDRVRRIAHNTLGKIGISSINRKGISHILGAGAASAHYANGGGHAVDFYSLGGTAITGAYANAVKLLQALDPVMPAGASGTGQSNCRTGRGSALTFVNMRQFSDSCTHVARRGEAD